MSSLLQRFNLWVLFSSVCGLVLQQSALMSIKENFKLNADDLIKRQSVHGLLACSHTCLSEHQCVAFKYESSPHLARGFCELYRSNGETLTSEPGWLCGWILSRQKALKHFNFTFTTLGAVGMTGPTDTAGYHGTTLEKKVTLDDGIQRWQIPLGGSYIIEAWGASGADGRLEADGSSGTRKGGLGAYMKGTFDLTQGTWLKILIGQQGTRGDTGSPLPGGGGGGTFVTLSSNFPLIVAGGGGGGGAPTSAYDVGDPGQSVEEGSQHGGARGSGGILLEEGSPSNSIEAGAGGGLNGNGESAVITYGGNSFTNGGKGGNSMGRGRGGFGGGGGGGHYPGAGGGYSGGGVFKASNDKTVAGGGGSYNKGENQVKTQGVNSGDGKVIITLINSK